MRLPIITIILLFFVAFIPIKITKGHFVQSEDEIEVTLHINPDDNPIIGEPAKIYFQFDDPENIIAPQTCNCMVSIFLNNEELISQSLFLENEQTGFDTPSLTFVFPEKGLYQIKVTGSPINNEDFSGFASEYSLRISREPENSIPFLNTISDTKSLKTIVVYLFTIMIVILIANKMINKKRNINE